MFQEKYGRYTEIGIVSFVHILGCELGYLVAFTRVTSYLDWIATNTGIMNVSLISIKSNDNA